MGRVTQYLSHIINPTRCLCCGRVIYSHQYFCPHCRTHLPHIAIGKCPLCGDSPDDCGCAYDSRQLIPCAAPFGYVKGIKRGIIMMKNGQQLRGVTVFGRVMANRAAHLYGTDFHGIVYVPMSPQGLRSRGFNQSRLLARVIAQQWDVPLLDGALLRLYHTPQQHRSPLAVRKGNVFGVFQANRSMVAGKRLLLVDDVFTTGTTINECAKALYIADCAQVCAITLASARYHDHTIHDKKSKG